ncbi:MAG: hypothetical protein LUF92_07210 [Clostridiales bacterium]|nr:hypothetical protein [Clostridiales bacterium]
MKRTDERLNKYIGETMYHHRMENQDSQEHMAEKLFVSPRSYWDQENGKIGFSGQTLCHFLVMLSDEEIVRFTRGLREKVWKEE